MNGKALFWLGYATLSGGAAPALAQDAGSNEIVVTAPGGNFDLDEAQGVGSADIRASGQPG